MTSTSAVDVIVVGAGIAGASAAAELSTTRTVLLIERERLPAQHASGRSAPCCPRRPGTRWCAHSRG
jgi:D-arginine dehydrogenase